MKRILLFSLTYHPFIGGAEVAVKETFDRIDPQAYTFDMITLQLDRSLPKFEKFGNIDIFRIGITKKGATISDAKKFPLALNKLIYPFWAFFYALVLHKRKPYDAVMTTMTSYASFAALFFKLVHPQVKYIFRSDDGDPFTHYKRKALIVGPLFRMLFTKADFLVATSSYLIGEVKKMGYRGLTAIVPNGVNAKHFSQQYSKEELDDVRKKIGKKEGDVFLITTSRLVKKNAIDDVIRSMKLLPKLVSFLVYGVGPDEAMLKSLAEHEGVSDRVRFLGQLAHHEMPKYLKVCDFFIRPSLSEGFGISFIEAMVAGIPVIATQVGGIADFLYDPELNKDHEPTGRAVKPRDPEGIAQAVMAYIDNPETTKQIVVNARHMAVERYDWDLVAKSMKEDVFDSVFVYG